MGSQDADLKLFCQNTHTSYRELDSITCVISISITPAVIAPVPLVEVEKFYDSNAQHAGGCH